MENCYEAQELNKTFHYVCLLLSILFVVWELPKDNHFPSVEPYLLEAMKYALMWVTKDVQQVRDSKIFWILMEMNIWMAINHKARLSPMVYTNLQDYAEFKAEFH